MHRSNRLSLGIFLALLPAIAFAQSITYQPPTDFFACGEASFSFTVQNPTGSSLNGATVTVNFTTTQGTACGVSYVAGSVTSPATEGNISNLSAPQFALPTIAAGSSLTFSINASANCVTAACIDNAEVFVNNITLSLNGGSSTVTTNPYVIDRALLLITNVSATVMSGSRGEVLQRKITVRNTRPGALSSFLFTDTHQPGIAISSQQGTAQPAPLGSFATQLGPADFASIGDGDGLFEFNETIVITEDVSILSCGVDESSCLSTIKVGWGCGGDICQEENVTAVIAFEQYEKAPVLTWEPIINVPECFCGPNAVQQGMKITNVGDGNAVNISFDVQSPGQNPRALIDPASVRVVSGGVDIPFNLLPSGNVSVEPYCDMPAVVTVQFVASGFNLTPGQSVTVSWDNYYCSTGCAQPGTDWRYRYSYYKECPPNIFTQALSYTNVSEQGLRLSTFINVADGTVVMDGETRSATYKVIYDSLSLLNGSLSIDLELPCGMEWVPSNQLLLAGQAPASINVVPGDSITLVTAVYDLPLPTDTALMDFDFVFHCDTACGNVPICDEVLETSCATPCQADPPLVYFADVVTSIEKCSDYPGICNLQSCTSLVFGYDCAVDSICLDQPPGYLRYEFSALRKNYGLPDNDNNQFADATSGLPDMNLVARQRFMPGDTVQATVRGVVEMDVEGASLPFGELELSFFPGTRMAPATRTTLLTPDGFKPAGSLLRIYDSSAGQWYECPDPAFTNSMFIRFTYDLDALDGGCLPAGFAFGQGDSLVFVGNYRINLNPAFESGGGSNDTDPLFGNILASPAVRLYDENAEDYTIINCFCEAEELELTYYQYTLTAATFALPPCDTSEFNQAMGFRIDLHQGNFFPFEYRPLLSVDELLLELPPSVELCTTRLINIRQQNGANVATQVFFPPNFQDGGYLHDLTNLQTPPLEEGFSANLNFRFKNACTNKLSLPMTYNTLLDWEPGLPEEDDPETVSVTANSLRPLIANLSISAPLFDLVSYTNQLGFDFMLKNTPTIVSSLNSGPAPNTWMYISSQSGLVTDFQLINLSTGQPVPLVNGLWQLGDLPVNPTGFPYRLVGTNNSCEREALQIHYGWNCDPMQSTVQAPCYEQVQPLFIESPPGEIDMLVTSPTGCGQLCDTVPYHRIEVFNAQFGTVYQLSVNAFLPPGMSVLPGSCEVEYPTGSGQFYPIADPTAVSTGIVEWNLSMLFDSIANGLPGVADAPRNSLTLRFLGETTCDFVADAYSLFIAAAELNCGLPSNTIAKPGDPICIEGVSAPYTTSISVNPMVGLGCADARSYEVSLMSSAALPPGACLIVTLPPGISYQPGSCENQCPTAFNCAPTVDGSQITWQLPAGVLPNQILCFRFATQGWNGLGCEEGVLLFRTAAETQALCVATGEVCSTKVSTGSLILPFEPQQPAYDLSNFSVSATSVGTALDVTFSVDVTNNGATSQPPTLLDFYVDTDGDGDGDQLVFTESYNSPIAAGQTVTVTVPALLGGGLNLCQLVAVLDASQQCACSGDVALVTSPIEYETGLAWTLCSGASQTIGVAAQPGFDYQWSPDDCLADDQAAMTVFSCENDGIVAETYAFSLSQSNGFCEINNLLSVTVQPVPGIAYVDSPVCQGESANLAATDGVVFNWQGPGIAQPNQQIQVVTPSATSTYSVTVTDATGCMGTDMATVTVAPQPVVEAMSDGAFCPGELAQLSVTFDPDWDYLWSPQTLGGQPTLSDPTVYNPLVLVTETTTFAVTVLDENGCSASDAVTVSFADSLLLTMPADLTICTGSTATLTVTTNGPATLVWSPDGNCLNPPTCTMLSVSPSSTTTYTASATSADGCTATGSVTVTVVNEEILTNGPAIEICEGETTVINGQVVSEAGVYCDTFTVAGGCDSIHCVELLLKTVGDSIVIDSVICPDAAVEFEGEVFNEAGFYCFTYPAQNGCDSTRCLSLALFDAPSISINVSADTLSAGDTLLLSIPQGIYESIQWYANDSLLADCTGFIACEQMPLDSSVTYTVVITDVNGCIATATVRIIVIPSCNPELAEMPNAFSPNGDQINDVFDIVGPGSEISLHLRVWNRWGQKVYDGPGPWDGLQDGKPAASDVYIYAVEVGCALNVDDLERVLKGDVTLLR